MGLLDKAVRGAAGEIPSDRGSGLFSRASAARQPHAAPSPIEVGGNGHGRPPTPAAISSHGRETQASPFPLSADELRSLREEILGLRLSADYLLASYARIAEAIPLQALGLFLAEGERLFLAASFGFPQPSEDFLPLSIAASVGISGRKLDPESHALISPLLGISPTWPIHAVALLAREGVVGMWVYADAALSATPAPLQAALAELLAAPASRCKPVASRPIPRSSAAEGLLAEASEARHACAFVLELASLPEEIGQHVPGVATASLISAVEEGARRVLGKGGAVSYLPNGRLAALLASASPLDPELALYQFRKSLKRSLALLEGVELPQGRAIALDLSAEETSGRLAAFLSE